MGGLNINEEFIQALKAKIPKKTLLADRIADVLCIEKETAYRRLRGDVQFSLREAGLIAKELHISLDDILSKAMSVNYNVFHIRETSKTEKEDIWNMKAMLNSLEKLKQQPHSEFGIMMAEMTFSRYLHYNLIPRFFIFKKIYHHGLQANPVRFDEIEGPETGLKNKLNSLFQNITDTFYIWDRKIISNFVHDIKYFENIRQIKEEEVYQLKTEMHQLLNELEQMAFRGEHSQTANKFELYITNINLSVNCGYLWSENYNVNLYHTLLNYVAYTENEMNFENIRNWIKSMKRSSTLVSGTGERERIIFFDQQRRIVDTL